MSEEVVARVEKERKELGRRKTRREATEAAERGRSRRRREMADEEGTVIVVVEESEREKKEVRVWVLGMTREKIWVAIVANGVSSGNDIGNELGFRVFGFLITYASV